MPIYDNIESLIQENLEIIAAGGRPTVIAIGTLTTVQFTSLNLARADLGLHLLESNEILFLGRHVYQSRSRDGYTTEDMVAQICSCLHDTSVVVASTKMSALRSTVGRTDGYGNIVFDQAVLEMTARRPKAELFSVIPKGDNIKPKK